MHLKTPRMAVAARHSEDRSGEVAALRADAASLRDEVRGTSLHKSAEQC